MISNCSIGITLDQLGIVLADNYDMGRGHGGGGSRVFFHAHFEASEGSDVFLQAVLRRSVF